MQPMEDGSSSNGSSSVSSLRSRLFSAALKARAVRFVCTYTAPFVSRVLNVTILDPACSALFSFLRCCSIVVLLVHILCVSIVGFHFAAQHSPNLGALLSVADGVLLFSPVSSSSFTARSQLCILLVAWQLVGIVVAGLLQFLTKTPFSQSPRMICRFAALHVELTIMFFLTIVRHSLLFLACDEDANLRAFSDRSCSGPTFAVYAFLSVGTIVASASIVAVFAPTTHAIPLLVPVSRFDFSGIICPLTSVSMRLAPAAVLLLFVLVRIPLLNAFLSAALWICLLKVVSRLSYPFLKPAAGALFVGVAWAAVALSVWLGVCSLLDSSDAAASVELPILIVVLVTAVSAGAAYRMRRYRKTVTQFAAAMELDYDTFLAMNTVPRLVRDPAVSRDSPNDSASTAFPSMESVSNSSGSAVDTSSTPAFSNNSRRLFWAVVLSSPENMIFVARVLLGSSEANMQLRVQSCMYLFETVLTQPEYSSCDSIWVYYSSLRLYLSLAGDIRSLQNASTSPNAAEKLGSSSEYRATFRDLTGRNKKRQSIVDTEESANPNEQRFRFRTKDARTLYYTCALDERLCLTKLREVASTDSLSVAKRFSASLINVLLIDNRVLSLLLFPWAEHEKCVRRVRAFWKLLLSPKPDVSSLPRVVSSIDDHIRLAERYFDILKQRFPKDTEVEKAYHGFLFEMEKVAEPNSEVGASIPAAQVARVNTWHNTIVQLKDKQIFRLRLSVLLSAFIVLCCVCIAFGVTLYMFSTYSGASETLTLVSRNRRISQGVAIAMRLEIIQPTLTANLALLQSEGDLFQTNMRNIETASVPNPAKRNEILHEKVTPKLYIPATDSFDTTGRQLSMKDLTLRVGQTASNLAKSSTLTTLQNASTDPSVRYVLDNSISVLFSLLSGSFTKIVSVYDDTYATFVIVLVVLLCIGWVIPLFLLLGLFYPAAKRFVQNRAQLYSFFGSIPKGMVQRIVSGFKIRGTRSTDSATSESDMETEDVPSGYDDNFAASNGVVPFRVRKDPLRRLSVVFILTLLLSSILITVICIHGFVFLSLFRDNTELTSVSGDRRSIVSRLHSLSVELVANDTRSWSSRSQILVELQDLMREVSQADLDLRSKYDGLDSRADSMHYDPFCSDQSLITCRPLATLLGDFLYAVSQWASAAQDPSDLNLPLYTSISQMESYLVSQFLTLLTYQNAAYDRRVDVHYTSVIVCFAVLLPILFACFVWLISSLAGLEHESQRARLLFLWLPWNWLKAWPLFGVILFGDSAYNGEDANVYHADLLKLSKLQLVERQVDLQTRFSRLLETSKDGILEIALHVPAFGRGDREESPETIMDVEMTGRKGPGSQLGIVSSGSRDPRVENCNRAFCSMVGLDNRMVLGRSLCSFAATADDTVLIQRALSPDSVTRHVDVQFSRGLSGAPFPVRLDISRTSDSSHAELKDAQSEQNSADTTVTFLVFVRDMSETVRRETLLEAEKRRADTLLQNILPYSVADRLQRGETLIADMYDEVTIFFSDIKGFTQLSSALTPAHLVRMLNSLVTGMDRLALHYGVEKVKTIGDAYLCVAGAPQPCVDHPVRMIEFSFACMELVKRLNDSGVLGLKDPLQIRVGVHSGQVIAGCIGENRYIWDVYSEDVNICSRLESTGFPGRIHISRATFERVHSMYDCETRTVMLKGVGEATTYFVHGRTGSTVFGFPEPNWEEILDPTDRSRVSSAAPSVNRSVVRQVVPKTVSISLERRPAPL
eukprot:ANDGO_07405.mRNA.1 Adenylate cyclase